MSMYLQIDNGEPAELASNKGLADFWRWVDELDEAKFGELVHLREHGWADDTKTLTAQIAAALEENHPHVYGVADVAKNLASLAGGAGVVNISDGLIPESA